MSAIKVADRPNLHASSVRAFTVPYRMGKIASQALYFHSVSNPGVSCPRRCLLVRLWFTGNIYRPPSLYNLKSVSILVSHQGIVNLHITV